MADEMLVFDWEDAVNFIAERCEIDKETIEKVLSLEEDYMRSVGIIDEDENSSESDIYNIDGRQRTYL